MIRLTPRQIEVLGLIARGKADKEIGVELHISRGTVSIYVQRILKRLGANSRAHAVYVFYNLPKTRRI